MGTGYTTLDPRRRKFPPPVHSDADDVEMIATDLGDGSPIPFTTSRNLDRDDCLPPRNDRATAP